MDSALTQPRTRTALTVIALIVGTAALQWAQAVAVPIALAILLSFVLAPVVAALERRRLPSPVAVVLVVALTFGALASVGWVIGVQVAGLVKELPRYRENLLTRIADIRVMRRDTGLEDIAEMVQDLARKIAPGDARSGDGPLPVTVESPSVFWRLPSFVQALATAAFVIVLVIFLLLRWRDGRARIIQLVGDRRLAITTKALDEMSRRITQYLVRQSIVNAAFGAAVAAGLLAIGLPYALVWGALAGTLRFVPYIGTWIAALAPTLVSLAVFPGWFEPLLVVGLMAALELGIYAGIEPWLYGRGAGLSEIALLIAVAFWTWLWGPIGLVLATPVTVCVVVLSKHIPGFAPLSVLLDETPKARPADVFYQRLVAQDGIEAANVAHAALEGRSIDKLVEDVFLSAVRSAKRDREREGLTEAEAHGVYEGTAEIARAMMAPGAAAGSDGAALRSGPASLGARLVFCPVSDEGDKTALFLLALMLGPALADTRVTSHALLVSETLEVIQRDKPDLVCVGSLPPGGLRETRFLVRRLRARFPDLPLVVGRWDSARRVERWREQLVGLGIETVLPTLAATRTRVELLLEARRPDAPVHRG